MTPPRLSRREQQVMDVVRARGRVSAADVHAEMEDPPSYSTVRSILTTLEQKRHVRHDVVGRQYVYSAVVGQAEAQRSALRHLLRTVFAGSAASAFTTLLDLAHGELTDEELERIEALIEAARSEQT